MGDDDHQLELRRERVRKGGRFLYFALFIFVALGVMALFLSPAGTRSDVLLRFLAIVASWPVVAGIILISFFKTFQSEISSYMKFAKLKYGDFEVSADQSKTPAAALGAVAIETKELASTSKLAQDVDVDDDHVARQHSELKTWLVTELERRELESNSWKHVFLDQFLVEAAKGALVWFHNFIAVPENFYHRRLDSFVPDPEKRSRILQTLLELGLVHRHGDLISITDEGTKYYRHLYASASADGRQVRHPFVSRADVEQYGKWGVHGHEGTGEDMCHHHDIEVRPRSTGAAN